ncbi:hypothetical protein [Burkholderia alba]|uniref:hypothetical protein n=1 Tax=Burkholderia alba TaxID=2683677 RepID=UPI002B0599E2|nr:hypothetical protein [Burkholderia alba]
MINATVQAASAALFTISAYAILSPRIRDGVLGKLCWSFLALACAAIFIGRHPLDVARLNAAGMVGVAGLLFVREAILYAYFKWRKPHASNSG